MPQTRARAAQLAYGVPQDLPDLARSAEELRKKGRPDARSTAGHGRLLYLTTKKVVFPIAVFLKGGKVALEVREIELSGDGWVMSRHYYAALCLSQCRAEDWVGLPQPLAAALAALMRSQEWDKVEHKLRCLAAISRADLDLRREYVLGKVVDTYLELDDNEEERFTAELEREEYKEIRVMAVTWEEALAEREAKGRTEGKAEGKAEGQVEAIQGAILLLADRFWHEVPADFAAKIRAIHDIDRLHAVLEQIPGVRSAADLAPD